MPIYTKTLRTKAYIYPEKIRAEYVLDGTVIETAPVAELEPNTYLEGQLLAIPEDLYNLEPTTIINKVCSSYAEILSNLSYWIYFGKLSQSLDTVKYDRLDANFGNLFNVNRFDGYFYNEESDIENLVNVYRGQTYSLKDKNIVNFGVVVTNVDTEEEYIIDNDYTVNYLNGTICILLTSSILNGSNLKVDYLLYVYDENTDETYDYNPYENLITENIYIGENGTQLKYVNITAGTEQVKEMFGDNYFFRDKDYLIDYSNGYIYYSQETSILSTTKLEVVYRTNISEDYEMDSEKETLEAPLNDGRKYDLSHKLLDSETVDLYRGEW